MHSTKQMIMESALRLFSQKGIYQTSLKDIAEDIGISKGTIFYHFPTKDDLLYEIMDHGFADVVDDLFISAFTVVEDEKGQKKIISRNFNFLKDNNLLFTINIHMLEEAICGNEIILGKLQEQYCVWRKMFYTMLTGCENATVSETELQAQSAIILAIVDGLHVQYSIDPQLFDLKALSEQAARAVNSMICGDFSETGGVIL